MPFQKHSFWPTKVQHLFGAMDGPLSDFQVGLHVFLWTRPPLSICVCPNFFLSIGIVSHYRKNSSSEFRNAWPPHLHSTPLGAGVSSQELSFTNSKTKNLHGDMDPSQVDYYIGLFTHVTPLCPPSFLYSQLESRRQ